MDGGAALPNRRDGHVAVQPQTLLSMKPLRKIVRFEPWPDKPLITIKRKDVIFILCGIVYVSSPFRPVAHRQPCYNTIMHQNYLRQKLSIVACYALTIVLWLFSSAFLTTIALGFSVVGGYITIQMIKKKIETKASKFQYLILLILGILLAILSLFVLLIQSACGSSTSC